MHLKLSLIHIWKFAEKSFQNDLVGFGCVNFFFDKGKFPDENGENQTVLGLFMPVVRAKLSGDIDKFSAVILIHIYQTFRNHQWNFILGVAQASDQNFYGVKTFPKDFVAEPKLAGNFSNDSNLVVFNHLI